MLNNSNLHKQLYKYKCRKVNIYSEIKTKVEARLRPYQKWSAKAEMPKRGEVVLIYSSTEQTVQIYIYTLTDFAFNGKNERDIFAFRVIYVKWY